jgi:hypothetical protein
MVKILAKIDDEVREIKFTNNWIKDIEEIEKNLKDGFYLVYDLVQGKFTLKEKPNNFDIKLKRINFNGENVNLIEEVRNLLNWHSKYFVKEEYRPLVNWLKHNKPHYYRKILEFKHLTYEELNDLLNSLPENIKNILLRGEIEKEKISKIVFEIKGIDKEKLLKKLIKKADEITVWEDKKGNKLTIFRRKDGKWLRLKRERDSLIDKKIINEDEVLKDLIAFKL